MTYYRFWWKYMWCKVYQYGDRLRVVGFKGGSGGVGAPHALDDSADDPSERFESNVARARSRIRELAFCNDWQYFVTVTVSEANQDRTDRKKLVQRFQQCLKDFSRKFGAKVAYLIIPELHSDGRAWHVHGLFQGVPRVAVQKNPFGYDTIPYFEERFGWVSISRVRDPHRVSTYITKYISKDLGNNLQPGEHMFYSSHGLRGKVAVAAGEFVGVPWTYGNDFVKLVELDCDLEEFFTLYSQEKLQFGYNSEIELDKAFPM